LWTRRQSLYSISRDLAALLESDEEDTAEQLDSLLPTLESKASAVAHWCQYQHDLAATLKAREEAIREQRKAIEARSERSKQYLRDCMERAEIWKITDTRTGTEISLKKNPPKVVIDNAEELPNEFWRVPDPPPPAPDLKAIGAALKTGEVPGAHLEQGLRVEIKG
jgi:hypothetical protein